MNQSSLGEFEQKRRKEKALTQEELASLTELDIRTIQRIEKGEVKPYFSTLKILSEVLDYDFISAANNKPWQFSEEELGLFREKFVPVAGGGHHLSSFSGPGDGQINMGPFFLGNNVLFNYRHWAFLALPCLQCSPG